MRKGNLQKTEEKTEKMSPFFLDYIDAIPTMEGRIAALFQGFFKNKMQHVVGILTNPRVKRPPQVLRRVLENLEDFYHHFSPRDRYHEGLYEELIEILKAYPGISKRKGKRGLANLAEIFEIYDYKLDLEKKEFRERLLDLQSRRHDV